MSKDNFTTFRLENGLTVLLYPLERVNSVSIITLIRAGHYCEDISNNGIAHILEHTLFDGTKKYLSYESITDFFDKIAGEYQGATSYDFVTLAGRFVDEEMENAIYMLEELLFKPLLKEEYFKKERAIIQDELSTLEDNFSYQNYIQSKRLRYRHNSILSHPLGGTSESVKNLEHNQIIDFYKRFFVPNNMKIVLVGKFKNREARRIIKETLGKYPPNKDLQHKDFSNNDFSGKRIDLLNKRSKKSYIRITFPSFDWKSPTKDRVALAYICSLLSNRRDSLLFSRLREKLGWIYEINSEFTVSFDTGTFEIETSTPINRSISVIKEILSSIKKIKRKSIDKSFFEKVKNIDRKRIKMVFDDQDGILKWFSEEIAYRYPKELLLPRDLIDIYEKINVDDILNIANKIFDFEKINVSLLQPFEKTGEKGYKEDIENLISEYG